MSRERGVRTDVTEDGVLEAQRSQEQCDPTHSGGLPGIYLATQWEHGKAAICETSEPALSPLLCGRASR